MKRGLLLLVIAAVSTLACTGGGGAGSSVAAASGADAGDPTGTGTGVGSDGAGGPACASRPAGSWTTMSNAGAPADVYSYDTPSVMSAWTGNTLVILYHDAAANALHGKSYDPESNTWADLDVSSVPADAAWMRLLGTKLVVWGKSSGAVFDPASRTWTARALPDAPQATTGSFVGSKLVQVGHVLTDSYDHFESTRIYDFESGTWTAVSSAGAPSSRYSAAQVIAGERFVVWGGYTALPSPTNPSAYVHPMNADGAILDVSTGTWTKITDAGAPAPRHTPDVATAVDGKVVLWGGLSIDVQTDKTTILGDGALFDPIANVWSTMASSGAPSARWNALAVAAGSKVVVYGGQGVWPGANGANQFFTDGSTYDVAANAWAPLPPSPATIPTQTPPPPNATWMWHQAYEAGGRVVFLNPKLDAVQAFDPVANTWQSVAAPASMVGRSSYLAAWTGCRFVILGGEIVGDAGNQCAAPHTIGCDPSPPPVTPFYDGSALTL
jgi:hypothetical protein